MQSIYKAILRGDRIEWEDEVPEQIRTQQSLMVLVTIVDQPVAAADEKRGPRMAEVLERLAASGGVASITDPLQWQHEQRQDRDLPGRS